MATKPKTADTTNIDPWFVTAVSAVLKVNKAGFSDDGKRFSINNLSDKTFSRLSLDECVAIDSYSEELSMLRQGYTWVVCDSCGLARIAPSGGSDFRCDLSTDCSGLMYVIKTTSGNNVQSLREMYSCRRSSVTECADRFSALTCNDAGKGGKKVLTEQVRPESEDAPGFEGVEDGVSDKMQDGDYLHDIDESGFSIF